jgi:hypothetical protein
MLSHVIVPTRAEAEETVDFEALFAEALGER